MARKALPLTILRDFLSRGGSRQAPTLGRVGSLLQTGASGPHEAYSSVDADLCLRPCKDLLPQLPPFQTPCVSLSSRKLAQSKPVSIWTHSGQELMRVSWGLLTHHALSFGPPGKGGKSEPESDDDFKPQYRKPDEASPIHELISQDVKDNPVMVYMKGVPSAPMCGFSAGVVQILQAYGVDFKSRNVLEDPELRQGVKTFSQWPTIPQVFVKGEFVGGCDVLVEMHQKGQLEGLFQGLTGSAGSPDGGA